jgi:hypothetical protein
MNDTPKEPESDWEKWKPKKLIAGDEYYHVNLNLIHLRNILRNMQVEHMNNVLNRIDNAILYSDLKEANEVIKRIMEIK